MTAIQAIFIRGYEERTVPKSHIVYKIDVQAHVRSWQMWRRYSEFDDLHTELTKSTKSAPPCSLPPKHPFSILRPKNEPKVLEERRAGLETYLRAILSAKEDVWRESQAFKDFLGIPVGRQGTLASSHNPGVQFTSSTWLDEHSELQGRLRDVWSDINKRDALSEQGDIAASHKSNVTAKAKLAGVLARIGSMEKALQPLAMGGMSEGELQRRTDMVARLRDDCEKLSRMVTIARQTSTRAALDNAAGPSSGGVRAAPESDRAALLGSNQFARPARRVFGASSPPKESETTRPLDNQGLLSLQQTQMDQQDNQLSQLTTILQRHRQLGEAIGHEVNLQIEMLDDLDNEVDRVGGKLNSTKQKLNRLG
ncbi:hypothetical protein D9611_006850 [Ephemerocybe angulata]|uniref:Syntaxin n=1 Tax=Ephemerocybe angulata TaxID=980116 RepID=A0A8H5EVK5_9AGAR|nr:hypothetical protein D9611_006850 [Tulosesus angulatus]